MSRVGIRKDLITGLGVGSIPFHDLADRMRGVSSKYSAPSASSSYTPPSSPPHSGSTPPGCATPIIFTGLALITFYGCHGLYQENQRKIKTEQARQQRIKDEEWERNYQRRQDERKRELAKRYSRWGDQAARAGRHEEAEMQYRRSQSSDWSLGTWFKRSSNKATHQNRDQRRKQEKARKERLRKMKNYWNNLFK